MLLTSCQLSGGKSKMDNVVTIDHRHGTTAEWFSGSVEEAFAKAKEQQRPIFVYWGAVWCPPCNQIKSEVFSHPDFPNVMQSVVPVYLDGDTEEAQIWSERLEVAGYPTLLLLSASGEEILRIGEFVRFDEFADAMKAALTSTSMDTSLARIRSGESKPEDWKLMRLHSWYDAKGFDLGSTSGLKLRKELADLSVAADSASAAVLNARLVAAVAQADDNDPETAQIRADVLAKMDLYTKRFLTVDKEATFAARPVILYNLEPFLSWTKKAGISTNRRNSWKSQWLKAVDVIKDNDALPAPERIWTIYPEMTAYKFDNPKKPLPRQFVENLKRQVANDTKRIRDSYARASFVPGAAYLLREAGEAALARDMLEQEAKTSKAPWYLYSSLASLEERLGNESAALAWSKKAAESAKGRATRLQWQANHILRMLRSEEAADLQSALAEIDSFYEMLFGFQDGFAGRNRYRIEALEKSLEKYVKDPKLSPVLAKYQSRCASVPEAYKKRCTEHFAALVP